MKTTTTVHRLLGLALALPLAFAHAVPTTEPLDIDPDFMADIAKQKARANAMGNNSKTRQPGPGNRSADPSAECGSINIGNVVGNRRVGFAPVDINVVVLGDILNMNNKCK
jgi:hypothetical protein